MLGAIDFTTIEVWTKGGLVTFYLLFVMEIATRRVHFAGCTPNPDDRWMKQIARNLTDAEDGFLKGKRYVLMDRDGKFSPAFQAILKTEGVEPVLLPREKPEFERPPGTVPSIPQRGMSGADDLLRRGARCGMRFASSWPITTANAITKEWAIGSSCPVTKWGVPSATIECRERLGGLLRYYYRKAA